jgi:1-aminocyclopropane-1-carboxylate deaminase
MRHEPRRFPRHTLTFGPSPIEALPRLSAHLGGKVELRQARGHAIPASPSAATRCASSNTSSRRRSPRADTLVSIGGVQSNHTRMVAAVAAKIGMKCRLVQESWVPHEDAVYDRVGNILMSRVMGAHVELVDEGFDIGIRESWENALEDVKAGRAASPTRSPPAPPCISSAGSAIVGFAEEVRAQEAELGFKFDYIFVCTVTGSTHAGMVVGFAADGRADRVIGIDASATPEETKAQVLSHRAEDRRAVDLGREITADDVVLDTRTTPIPNTACPRKRRSRRSASRRGSKA